MCTGLGIGQGLQPVAAFNYGVKDYTRVKKALYITLLMSLIVVTSLALVGLIIPDKIVWLFQHDGEVIRLGTNALRYSSIGIIFLPLSVVANMLFQSIRKNLIASILSTLRSGAIFIPVLYIFNASTLGFEGIAMAQPVADVIAALISVVFIILFIIRTPNTKEDEKIEKIAQNE